MGRRTFRAHSLRKRASAMVLKSVLREPLVHFLLFALLIFAAYRAIGTDAKDRPDSIVVTAPKIEQMAILFTKTWQRSPTAEELKGLIDDYVKEEILVRQALALGLDKDDTVVRRRLRQKMEFLNVADADALGATDAELEAYLAANPRAFDVDAKLAFQQIFLNRERRGETVARDATSNLQVLLTNPAVDYTSLGDATMLPSDLPLTDKTSIAQTFGMDFAEALDKALVGQWTGPVLSSFGFHLVRVVERKPGRVPSLDEVRDAVTREWINAKRRKLDDQRFAELLKGYVVRIESLTDAKTSP
ncbi:peptidyl-prolyl cis-trans isomerase [Rhizobium leguminosarum]|uniref:peptidylprolyl isomerase n=1 Tax=Rhizobium leguminosarum TaxID=384 RepID=UPI001FDEE944|nr:peptidylprolyl isomerase [Rhizobium leguminosarum]